VSHDKKSDFEKGALTLERKGLVSKTGGMGKGSINTTTRRREFLAARKGGAPLFARTLDRKREECYFAAKRGILFTNKGLVGEPFRKWGWNWFTKTPLLQRRGVRTYTDKNSYHQCQKTKKEVTTRRSRN